MENTNIPTAEEYIENNMIDYWDGGSGQYKEDDVKKALIEFAKLHVEAALKQASKTSKTKRIKVGETINHYNINENVIDKRSIINAYPLTNIK